MNRPYKIYNTLDNVRLVLKTKRNLISLGLLDSIGYNYKSKNKIFKMMRGVSIVMKGKLLHDLHILDDNNIEEI